MNREVVVVDGMRTAFGRNGGSLRGFYATDLCAAVLRALTAKYDLTDKVDSVVLGSAFHDVHCNNFARYSALSAGLPYETSATFMEMQCGSGIAAINHAAMQIMCGAADIAIAGGGESCSQRFAKFSMAVEPYKAIPPAAVPNFLAPEKDDQVDMIKISDSMAQRWNISREACDEFALRSQQLAGQTIESGWFDGEIVPVEVPARSKKEPAFTFDKDEHPRPTTNMEGLAKLRAVNEGGVTTAGNASGRNDGASALLLMSTDKAKELELTPIARWVAGADVGVDPKYMGIGPVFSNLKTLKLAGLGLNDIDVFECNEAFAAQNLACIKELENRTGSKIDMDKWNPNGGAIAFGHPNGASGGRIAIAAVRQLERRGGRYGLVTSCCGGGLGVSALFERI
ncbi:MAG: thiolase family protein [Oscillospiraceae bacterium]|nr:thiolase family protein [Oscillospiraceae bacterium]